MLRYLKFLFVAAASATQNNVPANQKCTVPTKEEFTETLVKEYCTMSGVYATNKPNTFPMGMLNGGNIPLSCLEGEDEDSCDKQFNEWQTFLNDKTRIQKYAELGALREQRGKKLTASKKDLQTKFDRIVDHFQLDFTPEQSAVIKALLDKLLLFKSLYMRSQLVKDKMLGNCGEQANYVGINLFRHAQRNGLKLNIKLVSTSVNAPNNIISDHIYLLLNSDAPVVNIVNDAGKTKAYLEALKQSPNSGKICDSWQSRKDIVSFSQDTSNLYDHNAGWTSINVQELNFDLEENLKNSNLFPLPIQKFFCEEFARIELSEDLGGTCEQVENNYKKLMNRR